MSDIFGQDWLKIAKTNPMLYGWLLQDTDLAKIHGQNTIEKEIQKLMDSLDEPENLSIEQLNQALEKSKQLASNTLLSNEEKEMMISILYFIDMAKQVKDIQTTTNTQIEELKTNYDLFDTEITSDPEQSPEVEILSDELDDISNSDDNIMTDINTPSGDAPTITQTINDTTTITPETDVIYDNEEEKQEILDTVDNDTPQGPPPVSEAMLEQIKDQTEPQTTLFTPPTETEPQTESEPEPTIDPDPEPTIEPDPVIEPDPEPTIEPITEPSGDLSSDEGDAEYVSELSPENQTLVDYMRTTLENNLPPSEAILKIEGFMNNIDNQLESLPDEDKQLEALDSVRDTLTDELQKTIASLTPQQLAFMNETEVEHIQTVALVHRIKNNAINKDLQARERTKQLMTENIKKRKQSRPQKTTLLKKTQIDKLRELDVSDKDKKIIDKAISGTVKKQYHYDKLRDLISDAKTMQTVEYMFEKNNRAYAKSYQHQIKSEIRLGRSAIDIVSSLKARGITEPNAIKVYEKVSGQQFPVKLTENLDPTNDNTLEDVDIGFGPKFEGTNNMDAYPTVHFIPNNATAIKVANYDNIDLVENIRLVGHNTSHFKQGSGVYEFYDQQNREPVKVSVVLKNSNLQASLTKELEQGAMNDTDLSLADIMKITSK